MCSSQPVSEIIAIGSILQGVGLSARSISAYFLTIRFTIYDKAFALVFIVALFSKLLIDIISLLTSSFTYEDSFKAVEHIILVIVAVISAAIGAMISRNSNDDIVKFRFRSVFYSISAGLLIYSCLL